MNKKTCVIVICLLLFSSVGVMAIKNEWLYQARDRVTGRNMEVLEFSDELGIIDTLVYNEMIKRNTNNFVADITFSENEIDEEFKVDKFKFDGSIAFSDKSKVKYELDDFEVEWTNVDSEDNYAELGGNAVMRYKATIVIEKEIPVKVYADFYKDKEDKSYQENNLEIVGEDFSFELEGGKFKHKTKCYIGC